MHHLLLTGIVFLCCLAPWIGKGKPVVEISSPSDTPPQKWVANIGGNFRTAKITDDIKDTCSQAIKKMKIAKTVTGGNPVQTMEDAQRLIWQNISIAGHGPRACTEYEGWFMISRLNWAKLDDGSFKSGLAVKKGTTDIYEWDE